MDSFKSRGDTVLFVLLLLTGQLCVIVQCCSSHGHVNGCSIPFGWPYFYKSRFKPDCDKHDICYACGAKYGKSRSACDSVFVKRLRTRCSSDPKIKNKVWCRMVTTDYYLAVRLGGSPHYQDTSPSWCTESWVSACV